MKTKRKRRHFHSRRTAAGAAPGSIVVDPEAHPSRIRIIAYGPTEIEEHAIDDIAGLPPLVFRHPVIWVDVDGLGDSHAIAAIGERFGLHRLALEDVVNVHQRPKVEDYGDNTFVTARMPVNGHAPETEQLSMFLGENFLITFQERPGDCLEPVRERLRQGTPKIRGSGPDYLAYAVLDAVVDAYFPVIELYGDRLEDLEEEILERSDTVLLHRLHVLKRDLVEIRRIMWAFREVFVVLTREKSRFIQETTGFFLRDCYDHTIQLVEMIEGHREISAGMMDLHLSMVSNRMNEVMKVLTIIATIFIPLGFVAGLYGMNFDTDSPWNMPELGWRFGYLAVLAFMLATALGMLAYFRRAGWLGGQKPLSPVDRLPGAGSHPGAPVGPVAPVAPPPPAP